MHVVLFLTRKMSLQAWDRCGLLQREMALYQKLQGHGVRVSLVTYGGARDLEYSEQFPGIAICCNRWHLSQHLYEWLLPWLHRQILRDVDCFKTNQTDGAEIALRAARCFRKPLVARCGYMWSKNLRLEQGLDSPMLRRALRVETQVFSAAEAVVVTSTEMEQDLLERFPGCRTRLNLIPNYVDTELFRPVPRQPHAGPFRLCFVGRLAPEKNLGNLIDAVRGLGVELDIVGQGRCRDQLMSQAADLPQVRFHGVLPHQQLPDFLASEDAFIFPSLYEGHPKTPIEAMACGLPVIGTDIPGIRELIENHRTGLLCESDPASIRQAIASLLDAPERCRRMGFAARQSVVEKFSLERIVSMELGLYRALCRVPACNS